MSNEDKKQGTIAPDIQEIKKLLEELTIRLESIKTSFETLLFDYINTTKYCRGLELCISKLKIEKFKLEVENKELSVYHPQLCLLAENVACLIDDLPHNSPIRRPLLKHFVDGLEKQFILDLFEISGSTYYRALSTEDDTILFLKYALRTSKVGTVSPRMENIIKQFLDHVMPFASGRNYRIQRGPFQFVYKKYCEYLNQIQWPGKPCAKSYL